ncbi:alpha/beta hydrolase [Ferruginibacter sp. SUN002]|uniref:alpha/beta hydrolase n=1 Tax=Ferruginibacter sp. SUN002 TaxID=2937789 RepID=UPI003D36BB99
MSSAAIVSVNKENHILTSVFLKREVVIDCYLPQFVANSREISLLLINDGQDLIKMDFQHILYDLYNSESIAPLFCVGIHCSADRKNEYGTADVLDYQGLGAKAALHTRFVMEELLPFIRKIYQIQSFKEKSFAGFSLGGLSALDIVWKHAAEFSKVGVFSGSLWWRDKDQNAKDFNEDTDRIMHRLIRTGTFAPWLSFFFEVGTQDETADRNNNGIIDAIDDTVSLIDELLTKGYTPNQIKYVELQDGKHDVATWARAFPDFLKWGWEPN